MARCLATRPRIRENRTPKLPLLRVREFGKQSELELGEWVLRTVRNGIRVESVEILLEGHKMARKVQVSFSDRQMELLDHLRGELGDSDADVVRSIVLAWLAEKSFISTVIKRRMAGEHTLEKPND